MKSTAAELYASEGAGDAAYQHAFKYIRQLAIHLREGLKNPTKVGLVYIALIVY
jgi:nucleolar complex protein 2